MLTPSSECMNEHVRWKGARERLLLLLFTVVHFIQTAPPRGFSIVHLASVGRSAASCVFHNSRSLFSICFTELLYRILAGKAELQVVGCPNRADILGWGGGIDNRVRRAVNCCELLLRVRFLCLL